MLPPFTDERRATSCLREQNASSKFWQSGITESLAKSWPKVLLLQSWAFSLGPLSHDSARHLISSLASSCMQHILVQSVHYTTRSRQLALTHWFLTTHSYVRHLLLATWFLCPEYRQTSSSVQMSPVGTQQLPDWFQARKPQGIVRLPSVCWCFPLPHSLWWAGGKPHRLAVSTHSRVEEGISTLASPPHLSAPATPGKPTDAMIKTLQPPRCLSASTWSINRKWAPKWPPSPSCEHLYRRQLSHRQASVPGVPLLLCEWHTQVFLQDSPWQYISECIEHMLLVTGKT